MTAWLCMEAVGVACDRCTPGIMTAKGRSDGRSDSTHTQQNERSLLTDMCMTGFGGAIGCVSDDICCLSE